MRNPEHRRDFAHREIERNMKHFSDLPKERLEPIISAVLDAVERDEYWQVLERINAARDEEVGVLAEDASPSQHVIASACSTS